MQLMRQLFWKSKIEENTSIPCLLVILRLSVHFNYRHGMVHMQSDMIYIKGH